MNVPDDIATRLSHNGFERQGTLIRLTGQTVETKLMPILSLSPPTQRDIPALSKLMQESYAKSKPPQSLSVSAAARTLHDIMEGAYGEFIPECSFLSGSIDNPVSACFTTSDSLQRAEVTQLFTHPLYRAEV